jgi:EpsI family protein
MKSPRYWTVVLLLLATAIILFRRDNSNNIPYSEPLSLMPQNIGGWTSRDFPLDDAVLAILGKGDFLNRIYSSPTPTLQPVSGSEQPFATNTHATQSINLFIAYFASQRSGQSIHSPQWCLPGSGWTFQSTRYTDLVADNGKTFHLGEYIISNGNARQFVIYWYQSHGRSIANEYVARAYMTADSIRYNRTDGSLVRVITPIGEGEAINDARARAVRFTQQMAPLLPRFIPD